MSFLVFRHHVANLLDGFSVGEKTLLGLTLRSRKMSPKETENKLGGFYVDLYYKGIASDDDEKLEVTSYDGEFTNAPLETIPILRKLKDEFGGYIDENGELRFPPNLYGGAIGTGAGGFSQPTSGSDRRTRNPLYGQKTWPLFHSVYTRAYSRRKIPADILKKIGTIVKNPPGMKPFLTPKGRDWLFEMPAIRGKGDSVEIVERYKLSPPGGWPPHVPLLYSGGMGFDS